ncbi:myosin-6 [Benincasa hispida]|uniref:myosin-6 n=1 Tax=Benincasa hispida TaxID=102211 RepID=UPI001902148F|nr:myosin-6 [Benincasa hispida]XP_038906168.1 myosin-6 [Benincasa hispida]XP_038906169.1 myosin-6 [Benincasa hispida]XP_038906170.1 myosin-6 [Benincasa hispida]
MDNEKKKRKNKKKKKQQIRTSEDELIVSESTSVDDTHMRNGLNDQNPISDAVDLSYQHISGTKDAKEDTIKHLHEENNIHTQRMADLELKLVEYESEKHSWLQKEAALMDKIRSLQEDKTALDLEGARLLDTIELLERDKASLILNEKSSWETIVDKNKDISRLQAQVVELEEQRRDLLQENKQLTENVADYQSKLLNLERKLSSTYMHSSGRVTKEMLSSQVDAARILVDKLITENAELIGKVNGLFVELQRVTKTELSSGVEPDQMAKEATGTATFNDPEPPLILNSVTSSKSLDALESVPIHNHSIGSDFVDLDNDFLASKSSMPMAAGEIEQTPLHEIEDRNRDRELPATGSDEQDVLLSDAPLIGAPYRLISFMAKYVSGADLVGKS